DAARRTPEARDDLTDRGELAVRNRDALADRRRGELLTLDQHARERRAMHRRMPARHVVGELLEDGALLRRLQRRNDHVAPDEVDDLHQTCTNVPLFDPEGVFTPPWLPAAWPFTTRRRARGVVRVLGRGCRRLDQAVA